MLRSLELCTSSDSRENYLTATEDPNERTQHPSSAPAVLHPGKAGDKYHVVAGNGRFLAVEVPPQADPCACECGAFCNPMVYNIPNDQQSSGARLAQELPSLRAVSSKRSTAKISLAFIIEDASWPEYNIYEKSSWASHRSCLDEADRRPGIRVQIIKAEVRGPKTAPHVAYIMHVRTAFTVRGLSRRYSDFKDLDHRLRADNDAVPVLPSKRYFGSLSATFIHERKRQLQSYLDSLLADVKIARCDAVVDFLAIRGRAIEEQILSDKMEDRGPKIWFMPQGAPTDGVEQVLEMYQRRNDKHQEVRTLNCLALMHSENGNPEKAIPALQEAVGKCRMILDKSKGSNRSDAQEDDVAEDDAQFWGEGLLVCISNLACVLARNGSLDGALDRLRECAAEAALQGDIAAQARSVCKMGLVMAGKGDVNGGIRVCRSGIEMLGGLREEGLVASMQYAIAGMYWSLGEVRSAVDMLETSLLARRRARDALGLAESLHRLGGFFVEMGHHAHALDHVEQAVGLCRQAGDREGELSCLEYLAAILVATKQPHAALQALDRAHDLAGMRGDVVARVYCHEAMAAARRALGDTWLARVHMEESQSLRAAAGLLGLEIGPGGVGAGLAASCHAASLAPAAPAQASLLFPAKGALCS